MVLHNFIISHYLDDEKDIYNEEILNDKGSENMDGNDYENN